MNITYLTIDEISQSFKVTRKTIERWIKKGLPTIKVSGSVRINPESLEKWIEGINSDNPIKKAIWLERELREKIIFDLYDEYDKKKLDFDYFKCYYPHDIYIKPKNDLENQSYVINVCSLPDYQLQEGFWEELNRKFNLNFNNSQSDILKLIVVYSNFSLLEKPFETRIIGNTKLIILNPSEIINFNILDEIFTNDF